jgi:hypothetical protein
MIVNELVPLNNMLLTETAIASDLGVEPKGLLHAAPINALIDSHLVARLARVIFAEIEVSPIEVHPAVSASKHTSVGHDLPVDLSPSPQLLLADK